MLSVKLQYSEQSPTPLSLDIQIPADQGIVGIMGHSGCGKTTLLRVIAGLEVAYQGQVSLNGDVLFAANEQGIRVNRAVHKRGVGLVFQDSRLFDHLNVADNLRFALKRAIKPLFSLPQVVAWFGLEKHLSGAVSTLSGGEKQRVAVARAVLHSPQLLLLDEPFVALDMASRQQLLRCLRELASQTQLPILFVSHDISDIRQLCDHLLIMDNGQCIAQGATHYLLNQLTTATQLAQPIAATLKGLSCDNQTIDNLLSLEVDDQILWVAGEQAPGQTPFDCLIYASEVGVSLSQLQDCSIANCLKCQLTQLTPLNHQQVVLTLQLQQQQIYAQISQYSATRLGLTLGMSIYAVFKASAVNLQRTLMANDKLFDESRPTR